MDMSMSIRNIIKGCTRLGALNTIGKVICNIRELLKPTLYLLCRG
jgi:hypothetical protein